GHEVDVVGQLLPDAGDAADVGLTAQLALHAHVPGHPGHLVGERGELVHHPVDGLLELQDLAPDLDGDLAGQVTLGDRGGDARDVPHLSGEVVRHEVDVVRQLLP